MGGLVSIAVGAFSMIVKTDCGTDGSFYSTSHYTCRVVTTGHCVLCNYQRLGTLAWYCDMVPGVTRSQTSRHAALTSPSHLPPSIVLAVSLSPVFATAS